jgi:FKBP-type peptidyl-prolyl cis-trans isomerase
MENKKRILRHLVLSGLIIIVLPSCLSTKTEEYEQKEAAMIQTYLESNPSLNFELKTSGLYYLDIVTGNGLPASVHDTAYVFYSVTFLDGTKLDSNVGTKDTLIFPIGEGIMISGFDEGITYMIEGGKAKFLVPSKLAYGSTGNYYGTIPAYTPLLFDVNLVRVKESLKIK